MNKSKGIVRSICLISLLPFLVTAVFVGVGHAAPQIEVTVDSNTVIGINNLSLGFQLDGYDISRFRTRTALQNLAEEADFKMVRFFHHRLGWAVSNWNSETMTGNWRWSYYDDIVNDIISIGAEPLICLGYGGSGSLRAPSGMARWRVDSYFPDPDQFAAYAREWVSHFNGRVKYWEILNEPYQHYFWTDSTKLARYTTFWNTVARAMRAENPNIFISHDGSTAKNALDYWIDHGDNLDFLGFHKYDTSTRNSATDSELFSRAESERLTDYGGSDYNWRNYAIEEARSIYGDIPVICGETNVNWAYTPTDPRIQTMTGAVWASITIRYQALAGLDYWLWWNLAGRTSVNNENFGMIDGYTNEPYYSYYVLKMFSANSEVGDNILYSSSSSTDVRAFAWRSGNVTNVMITHLSQSSHTLGLSGISGTWSYEKVDGFQEHVLQKGTLDASNEITLNGYTVMLLQSEVSTPQPPTPPTQYTLTILAPTTAGGRTSPAPGTYSFDEGTEFTMAVVEVYEGYQFTGWNINGKFTADSTQLRLTMNENFDVQPVFGTASPPPYPTSYFNDDFESGNFSEWTGTTTSSGESAMVVDSLPYHGNYHGRFTSNGDEDIEQAYSYAVIDEAELYARGYFYVAGGLPLSDYEDRFYFLRFRAGNQSLAGVGIRRNGNVNQWIMYARHGRGWVGPFYASTPIVEANRWYCVELHWRKDFLFGLAQIFVDGVKVIDVGYINTASFGNADEVDFGLISATDIQNDLTIYGDSFALSNSYIGPYVDVPLHEDDFESGNFSEWTGTSTSSGETATVREYNPHHGTLHARFTTDGDGRDEYSYCYKTIDEQELYARGYFYVARGLPLYDNTDRFYFLRFRSGNQSLAGVGIRHNGDTDSWIIYARNGSDWIGPVYASSPAVEEDRWYCVELHLKQHATQGLVELYVNGERILEITNINTSYFGNIDAIDFGLISATNIQNSLIVYGDCFSLSNVYIGPEPN